MNTLYFKYAIEVEKTRSITRAADNLFMAQPNLSKAIKELEEQLGFSIFKRTPKGVFPTPQGTDFLEYARNVLVQIGKMEAISRLQNVKAQRFAVSIPRVSYIAHAVAEFVSAMDFDNASGIDVSILETDSTQVIDSVADNSSGMGVIRYETVYEGYFLDYLKSKRLCFKPVWEFEYLALMSGKNPLASAEGLTLAGLSDAVEVAYGDTIIPYLSGGAFGNFGTSVRNARKIYVYERCNQFELLAKLPNAFSWASPVPEAILRRYRLTQRKCLNIGQTSKDMLIYRKGYEFSELDEKFMEKLSEAQREAENVLKSSCYPAD